MPETTANRTISRSAWLELKEEQKLVKDGYEFLDEKAILLAAEMLAQRERYASLRKRFIAQSAAAAETLGDAIAELGLDALEVYPAGELRGQALEVEERMAIGLPLLDVRFVARPVEASRPPVLASAAAERVRAKYLELLEAGAELAAVSANLERLTREYRRTWRRVRALENVILPDIRRDLAAMEEHLDLVEQEEIIRVRTAGSGVGPS